MAKKTQRQRAIQRLDRAWSIIVRFGSVDKHGMVECFTCGKTDTPDRMHCGHFASRRHMCTRWCPDNTRVQCPKCNLFESGRQFEFGRRLDMEEPGKADRVYMRARQTCKLPTIEILERAQLAERQAQDLLRALG